MAVTKPIASGTVLLGTPPEPGDDTAKVASMEAVQTLVEERVSSAFIYQGSTDCSTNPNYPAASAGHLYRVSVAGKIGGASGTPVGAGDFFVALADSAGGTEASVGTSWEVWEGNLQPGVDYNSYRAEVDKLNVQAAALASAGTVDIGAATGDYVSVTGNTTITSFGTATAGVERVLVFAGTPMLTHNATSLILPTGANITCAAGDTAVMRSLGSGNWKCVGFIRASGAALVMAAHASSHASGGGDAIKLDDLAAPEDNTDLDATTSAHGLMPKADKTKLDGVEAGADVTDAGNVAAAINGAAAMASPVNADLLPVLDSAASNTLRKLTWANLKATLKDYFDTLYAAVAHAHAASEITSGTLSASRLPTPTTTALGGVKRNEGTAGQYVTGIDTDGSLLRGTPAAGGALTRGSGLLKGHDDPGAPPGPPPDVVVSFGYDASPTGYLTVQFEATTYDFYFSNSDPSQTHWVNTNGTSSSNDMAIAFEAYVTGLYISGLSVSRVENTVTITSGETGAAAVLTATNNYCTVVNSVSGGGNGTDSGSPSGGIQEVTLIAQDGSKTIKPVMIGFDGDGAMACESIIISLKVGSTYYPVAQIGNNPSFGNASAENPTDWVSGRASASLVARADALPEGGSVTVFAVVEQA